MSVTIEVPPLDDDVELIAHEIEHVIEQLDAVHLAAHAKRRGNGVHLAGMEEPVFETLRARRVGLIVAAEIRQVRR